MFYGSAIRLPAAWQMLARGSSCEGGASSGGVIEPDASKIAPSIASCQCGASTVCRDLICHKYQIRPLLAFAGVPSLRQDGVLSVLAVAMRRPRGAISLAPSSHHLYAGVALGHRLAASARGAREALAQAQAPRAEPELVLHGRQVSRLLSNVRHLSCCVILLCALNHSKAVCRVGVAWPCSGTFRAAPTSG
jgi:hypothetical protein